jgi:hypothetical protein
MKKPQRTHGDLFLAILEEMFPQDPARAKMMRMEFEQVVLPRLKIKPEVWNKPISDEEYAETFKGIQKEMPHFLHYLMNTNFPPPPEDWKASQN